MKLYLRLLSNKMFYRFVYLICIQITNEDDYEHKTNI